MEQGTGKRGREGNKGTIEQGNGKTREQAKETKEQGTGKRGEKGIK